MFFYRQSNYVGNGCVVYNCMELKHDNDVKKIFFIQLEYSSKGPIELNATFGRSPEEILAQLCKPRKPRMDDEIIAMMRDESMQSLRKVLAVTFLE